jgi:hypothetical protein
MERIAIAMQDGGAGAGAQHGGAGRGPTSFLSCHYVGPPVGGLFGFRFSFRPHPRKFGVKRFLVVREVAGAVSGVACFWTTSLEKIIGGVIAIVSYCPGGWTQQSAVPRCAILSVGSRRR